MIEIRRRFEAFYPPPVPPPGAYVTIRVYNVLGQRVAELASEFKAPGYYEAVWNGKDSSGEPVASGIYLVHMRSAAFRKSSRIVLIK